jgi:hypothetical protein
VNFESLNPVIKNVVKFSSFLNLNFIWIIEYYTKLQRNQTMGSSQTINQGSIGFMILLWSYLLFISMLVCLFFRLDPMVLFSFLNYLA